MEEEIAKCLLYLIKLHFSYEGGINGKNKILE